MIRINWGIYWNIIAKNQFHQDLQRTTERGSLRSVETNTDMITSDQFTNTGDTPTASVKPTASASVKPTALAGQLHKLYITSEHTFTYRS